MKRETIIRKIVEIDVAGGSMLEESIQASDELLHASAVNEFWLLGNGAPIRGVSTHDVGGVAYLTPERIKFRLAATCATATI